MMKRVGRGGGWGGGGKSDIDRSVLKYGLETHYIIYVISMFSFEFSEKYNVWNNFPSIVISELLAIAL